MVRLLLEELRWESMDQRSLYHAIYPTATWTRPFSMEENTFSPLAVVRPRHSTRQATHRQIWRRRSNNSLATQKPSLPSIKAATSTFWLDLKISSLLPA